MKRDLLSGRTTIHLMIYVTFFIISCSSDESINTDIKVEGKVELVDEFGDHLDRFNDVKIVFELDDQEVITLSDNDGNFAVSIPSWEEVKSVTYIKDGFASQKLTTNPRDAEKYSIEMIGLSTMEVSALEVVQEDSPNPLFQISFEVENYFSDNPDKKRYFELQVYDWHGGMINNLRFFGFQNEVSWGNFEEIEALSPSKAKLTYSIFRVWFLEDRIPNETVEFRVYGATNGENYKYYEYQEGKIDNSLNEQYGSATVTLN